MSIGDFLAILGAPPILGVYFGSLALLVTTRTSRSAAVAMREGERVAVYVTAALTVPTLFGLVAAVALTA